MQKKKFLTTRNIALIGILGALAGLFMTLTKFPLPFLAPGFYKFDFSDVIVALGAFSLGPVGGILIALIKVLINLILDGTTTAGIGELSNFLFSCSYILPVTLIYQGKRTFKRVLIGAVVSTLVATVASALINYFMLIPAYVTLAGFPMEAIVGSASKINASVTDLKTLIVFTTIPFNLFKFGMISVVLLLLYKPVEKVLQRAGISPRAPKEKEVTNKAK